MFINKGNIELARYRLKTTEPPLLFMLFILVVFIFGTIAVWSAMYEYNIILCIALGLIIIDTLIFLYYMHINDEQHIKELNEIRVRNKFPEQKPKSFLKYLIT